MNALLSSKTQRHLNQLQKQALGKKKSFRMVYSVYEPPLDPQQIIYNDTEQATEEQPMQQQLKVIPPNPRTQFVLSLLSADWQRNIVYFAAQQSIDLSSLDRWFILSGEVQVISKNGRSFKAREGDLLFFHNQTRQKISQVRVLVPTNTLLIKQKLFTQYLKSYLQFKNAQKVKYLKCCPFFVWSESLSEELGCWMRSESRPRNSTIYRSEEQCSSIYVVRQGIVMLQRSNAVNNSLIEDYQQHYEKNEFSESDVTLLAKRGMVFGIDGILLKDVRPLPPSQLLDEVDFRTYEEKARIDARIYLAKTIGATQYYVLDKTVLEALLTPTDMQVQVNPNCLQHMRRICNQYTNIALRGAPKIQQHLSKKDIVVKNYYQPLTHHWKSKQKSSIQVKESVKKHLNQITSQSVRKKGINQFVNQELYKKIKEIQLSSIRYNKFAFPKQNQKISHFKNNKLAQSKQLLPINNNSKSIFNVKSYRSLMSSMD